MLTVCGQQHSFSTQERVFLLKCQSFKERRYLDLRGTRTYNLRIVILKQILSTYSIVRWSGAIKDYSYIHKATDRRWVSLDLNCWTILFIFECYGRCSLKWIAWQDDTITTSSASHIRFPHDRRQDDIQTTQLETASASNVLAGVVEIQEEQVRQKKINISLFSSLIHAW